jgi:hypothetical protein
MLAALSIALLSSILIMGCDGGGEVLDTSVTRAFTPEDTVTLNGIVATDKPLQGIVQAINTRGETSDEVPADADGRFTLDIPNYPPFLVRMIPRDQEVELFSFATSEGHVNLTPLTHLAMYVATGAQMDLQALFHDWDGSQLSPAEVEIATAIVNANLAPLLSKQGLDDKTYDFFRTDFKPNGTGMDAVLDTVRIHIDSAAETLSSSIRILDASGHPLLTFDAAASATPTASSSATGRKQPGKSR